MDKISRRGLLGLIGGFGGALIASTPSPLVDTATAAPRVIPPTAPPSSDAARECLSGEVGDLCEAIGRFEWFSLEGQYGFLREENGDRRILAHVTCFRAAGIKKISTNAMYRCAVLRRTKGWQAYRILEVLRPS